MSEVEPTDALPVAADADAPPFAWVSPGADAPPVGKAVPVAQAAPVAEAAPIAEFAHAPVAGFAPASVPVEAKRKSIRKRILWTVTATVVVLGLVTAGVVALLPSRSGNSVVAKVHCQLPDLSTCLLALPAGAVRLTSSDTWARQTWPSADLYASDVVSRDAQSLSGDTAPLLQSDGLYKIAHTDWNAVDGDNVDLIVLAFGTQEGARAWNSTRTGEIMVAYPGESVTIPGDSVAKAHAATKADSHGDVGDLVLDVVYSSPNQLNVQDLESWAGTELASLRTAPAAPADAVIPPPTQQVACTGRLTSCLAPMPSGAEHWQSPVSKAWVGADTLSTSQFVPLFWDKPTDQQSVESSFRANGVTGIAHQDWDIDNANEQADIYLIQTITPAGASALSADHFGEPSWPEGAIGINHNVPHEPGAQAWYSSKASSDGFTRAYFTQTIGNVIVTGWLYFTGSFDAGTADSWARS